METSVLLSGRTEVFICNLGGISLKLRTAPIRVHQRGKLTTDKGTSNPSFLRNPPA